MYHFSPRAFVQLMIAGVCLTAATSQIQAQTILATSTTSTTSTPNTSAKPAWHDSLPDKRISAHVKDGVFSVDGMVAKVKLNYSINDAAYMYFFVPGMGTAVVSLSPLPNSTKVKNAFDGSKLTFDADGHHFELFSDGNLVGGGKTDIYVAFDRSTIALARSPRVGFGSTTQSPYVWPLSAPPAADKEAHLVQPPPLPSNMLPRTKLPTPEDAQKPAAAPTSAVAPATTPQ